MWPIFLALADGTITYPAVGAIAGGVATPFIGAIVILWNRIDGNSQKCMEDRETIQKDRVVENNAWFSRVETLHKEHAVRTERMFDQMIKIVEENAKSNLRTIMALEENAKANERVEHAFGAMIEKLNARRD